MKKRLFSALCLTLCSLFLLASCGGAGTPAETPTTALSSIGTPAYERTSTPTTDTPVPTTDTPAPTTETPVPTTDTPVPTTDTPVPTTDTPVPTTDTPVPTTDTPVPTTDTPAPTTETPAPTTDTPVPTTDTPAPEEPLPIGEMAVDRIDGLLYKLRGPENEHISDGLLYGRRAVTLHYSDEGGNDAAIVSRDLATSETRTLFTARNISYGELMKLERGGFLFFDIDGYCLYFEDALDGQPEVLREAVDLSDGDEEWVNCSYRPDGTRTVVRGRSLTVEDLFGDFSLKAEIPEEYPYVNEVGTYNGGYAFLSTSYESEPVTNLLALDAFGNFTKVGVYNGNDLTVTKRGEIFINRYPEGLDFVSFPDLTLQARVSYRTAHEYYSYSDGSYVAATNYTDHEYSAVSIYDYGDLLYFDAPSPYGYTSVLDIENGVALLLCSKPGEGAGAYTQYTETLCLADLASAVPQALPDYRALADEAAARIEGKYPVTILARDDAIIEFPGFVAETAGADLQILEALTILEGVLDDFPAGFIDELFSEDDGWFVDRLTVCLTGRLTPTDEYGTSMPSAYAYTDYEEKMQYIVADVSYLTGLRSTFAHELMHAVDFRLDWIADWNAFPRWNYYVPYMSLYNYGYVGADGGDYYDISYTTADAGKEWFLDVYSKTFPIEDRARLFENMFCYESNGCWYKPYGRILDRMEYLASVIRLYFRSVSESEELPIWERALCEARPGKQAA